jgi:hypothetical protein
MKNHGRQILPIKYADFSNRRYGGDREPAFGFDYSQYAVLR